MDRNRGNRDGDDDGVSCVVVRDGCDTRVVDLLEEVYKLHSGAYLEWYASWQPPSLYHIGDTSGSKWLR